MSTRGAHETETLKANGYCSSLFQATCTCGWRGPIRNIDEADRIRFVLLRDGDQHRREHGEEQR
jgi:hypothetical protein